jgi:hypothetical protein
MIDTVSSCAKGRSLASLIVFTIALAPRWCAAGQVDVKERPLTFRLHSSEIVSLARSLASEPASDVYAPATKLALDNPKPDNMELTAFEENRSLVYASASTPWPAGGFQNDRRQGLQRLFRRLVILKPSIFVVDDEARLGSGVSTEWRLDSQNLPEIAGGTVRVVEGNEQLWCETLLPRKVTYQLGQESSGGPESNRYLVEMISQDSSTTTRFLHVLDASESLTRREVKSELIEEAGHWKLTILAENRVFRLDLPPPHEGAGDIAISTADGKTLLSRRLFPSGILPHGPEGARLLALWDSDYRARTLQPGI